jgi:16S rRNA (guanine1516-N2)-methyltransferase
MTQLVILNKRPHQHDAEMLAGTTGLPLSRSVPAGGVGIAFGPRGIELLTERDKVGHGVGLNVEWIQRELEAGAHALRSDPLIRAVGGAAPNGVMPVPRLPQPAGSEPRDGPGTVDIAAASALVRARPLIVDATAGFCNDAFHLAAVGFRVVALERHPAIHIVTWFNAVKWQRDPLLGMAARAVEMQCADSRVVLPRLRETPGVILLDPMFPPKRRRSALPPKPIQVLRLLAGDDEDATDLLAVARAVASRRVVVKRADDAPPLGDLWPDWSVQGKTVRYDVYSRVPERAPANTGDAEGRSGGECGGACEEGKGSQGGQAGGAGGSSSGA